MAIPILVDTGRNSPVFHLGQCQFRSTSCLPLTPKTPNKCSHPMTAWYWGHLLRICLKSLCSPWNFSKCLTAVLNCIVWLWSKAYWCQRKKNSHWLLSDFDQPFLMEKLLCTYTFKHLLWKASANKKLWIDSRKTKVSAAEILGQMGFQDLSLHQHCAV